MTFCIGEWSIQKCIYDLQSQSRAYHSSTQCENIGIIMLSGCLCTEAVRT